MTAVVQIPEHAVVAAKKEHVSCDLGGEAVILNMENGTYYGLNSVGNTIWQLIREPRPVREILSTLVQEYEVDGEECRSDLNQLLHDMLSAGLVEVTVDVPK